MTTAYSYYSVLEGTYGAWTVGVNTLEEVYNQQHYKVLDICEIFMSLALLYACTVTCM